MAADVRKDENENASAHEIESFSVFSDSATEQLSNISIESDDIRMSGDLPSYMIVHQQMRDVIGFQREALVMQLRSNISALNASKQCLNNTLECQGKTIKNLEVSIQNDYVVKTDFLELEGKLEKEQSSHRETQARLDEALKRLEASKAEAANALTKQREAEQAAFEKCCDSLRDDLQRMKTQNGDLKSVIKDKSVECDELKSRILNQKDELSQLRSKHEAQKVKYKQTVSESEVEKQQEAYLRQMSSELGNKNKNAR